MATREKNIRTMHSNVFFGGGNLREAASRDLQAAYNKGCVACLSFIHFTPTVHSITCTVFLFIEWKSLLNFRKYCTILKKAISYMFLKTTLQGRSPPPALGDRPAAHSPPAERAPQHPPPPTAEGGGLHGWRHEGQRAPLPRHPARGLRQGAQQGGKAAQGVPAQEAQDGEFWEDGGVVAVAVVVIGCGAAAAVIAPKKKGVTFRYS